MISSSTTHLLFNIGIFMFLFVGTNSVYNANT